MSPLRFASPPLFDEVARLLGAALSQSNSDLRSSCSSHSRLHIFCGIHCHLFNGQQAVKQIPIYWNRYGSLSKWEVTRLTGQWVWTVEPNVTRFPVKSLFLAVIMRFVLSYEPWRSVESIKALSLLICAFCCLYYSGCSSLAHTGTLCTVALNIQ